MKFKINKLFQPIKNWQKNRFKLKLEKELNSFTDQQEKLIHELEQYYSQVIDFDKKINEILGENSDLVSKLKTAVLSDQEEIGLALASEILQKRAELLGFSEMIDKADQQLQYLANFTDTKVNLLNTRLQSNRQMFTKSEISELNQYLEKITQRPKLVPKDEDQKQNIVKLRTNIVNSLNQISQDTTSALTPADMYSSFKIKMNQETQ